MDPAVHVALETLAKTIRRPMNQLANEAGKEYVTRRGAEVERALEATLARLRDYRERDPNFEEAIARVARAEADLGKRRLPAVKPLRVPPTRAVGPASPTLPPYMTVLREPAESYAPVPGPKSRR